MVSLLIPLVDVGEREMLELEPRALMTGDPASSDPWRTRPTSTVSRSIATPTELRRMFTCNVVCVCGRARARVWG